MWGLASPQHLRSRVRATEGGHKAVPLARWIVPLLSGPSRPSHRFMWRSRDLATTKAENPFGGDSALGIDEGHFRPLAHVVALAHGCGTPGRNFCISSTPWRSLMGMSHTPEKRAASELDRRIFKAKMNKLSNGATPDHSAPSLCLTCRNAIVVEGQTLNESFTVCKVLRTDSYGDGRPTPVPYKVTKCSEFDDKTHASLYEMKQIAWTLRTDGGARSIGFVSPAQLKREQQDAAATEGAPRPSTEPTDDPIWDPLKKERVY